MNNTFREGTATSDATSSAPPEVQGQFDLSRSQLMIWTGQQQNPGVPLYNMAFRFDIFGDIDIARFQAAFQGLVDRCDAMRTVFTDENGVPRQLVLRELSCPPDFVDLSLAQDPLQSVQEWIGRRCRESLDLGVRSFDSALLKVKPGHFVWYLNQHHLTMDAWSTAVICRRLARLYSELQTDSPDHDDRFPAYADYLGYERGLRDTPAFADAAEYWQQLCARPAQRSRLYGRDPKQRGTQTERVHCALGPVRSQRLRELAQQPGIRMLSLDMTLFNLFATVLFAYLWRVSGSPIQVVGTPAHNRSSLAFRDTVGLFIELFPLRTELTDDETFRSLLGKVATEAQAWLRHALPGSSTPAGMRLFNVVLNYIHVSFDSFNDMPLQPEWVHSGSGDPEHDLRLQVHDFGGSGELVLGFDLNCTVFDEQLRRRVPEHFLRLLDACLADPEGPLNEVNLTGEAECEQLIADFNRGATVSSSECSPVVSLFRDQVERTPDAPALLEGAKTVSYRELDERSDRLARVLVARGAGAGTLVGICLERSVELMLAILAVLKSGAGYVPLDSRLPAQRLRFILEDTNARLVVTTGSLGARLKHSQAELLELDSPRNEADTEATALPAVSPQHTAYVIYTSGSTGRPKGVIVEHAGLAAYVAWARRAFSAGKKPIYPLYSSIGFDLTVTSIFVPLICGGAVVIYPEDEGTTDLAVLRVFEEGRVSTVKLTPAHLRLVADQDLRNSTIDTLILGGEDLKSAVARRVDEASGGTVAIYNEYGPTEGVVGCMIHRFDPETDRDLSVPIGIPADGVRIYVLDAGLNPVPEGVTGELYIGGNRLARGYLNRDQETASRFLADPFAPGGRMYRTGDLARFAAAGRLEYLGRNDEQVKVGGVRIEPAEIEHALLEHPAVGACVVNVAVREQPESPGELRYCVTCGLASNCPGTTINAEGVCNLCEDFASYQDRAMAYFSSMDVLRGIIEQASARRRGDYDCMMLLSGGKDSSYALCQVSRITPRVLAVTLDNGFVSEGAKTNIRRVVGTLGVEHRFLTTPAMNAIFVDSLKRHSNVCHGCFKTLYTLATETALKEGIPLIVTGLSRGQFFETRLTPELFQDDEFDVEAIDRTVLEARKVYHKVDDAVLHLLDVDMFEDDDVFEQVKYVDFYRYCDVSLEEMYEFLAEHAPWIRPGDTGRSTNCLINDAGIHVHKRKEGFHNYALPYSWDVRIGHKERDAALDELNDSIDLKRVEEILAEIGYQEDAYSAGPGGARLAIYFTAAGQQQSADLRAFLAERLPAALVPSDFIQMEEIPLTTNGKVDRDALPDPRPGRLSVEEVYRAPGKPLEVQLADLWRRVLRVQRVGIGDNFFDLGGDSIAAIQIVAKANEAGIQLSTQQLFQHQTVEELAGAVQTGFDSEESQPVSPGPVPLTPIQHWFFHQNLVVPDHWNQVVMLRIRKTISTDNLRQALQLLINYHDALRLRFLKSTGGWVQDLPLETPLLDFREIDLRGLSGTEEESRINELENDLHQSIKLSAGRLVSAAVLRRCSEHQDSLMIVVNHLAVDAVSWFVLIEDLDRVSKQIFEKRAVHLPAKTASYREWAAALEEKAKQTAAINECSYWHKQIATSPVFDPKPETRVSSSRTVSIVLPEKETHDLVHELPRVSKIQPHESLISALALTLIEHFGTGRVRIDVEGHGRAGLEMGPDVSRTVGWFTALYPLALQAQTDDTLAKTLRSFKEQLRKASERSIGFGLCKYLVGDQALLEEGPRGAVLFNYLGQAERSIAEDSWFKFERPLGLSRSALDRPTHTWEINARIENKALCVDWGYSESHHSADFIASIAAKLIDNVRRIISENYVNVAQTRSASDFPLANLDQDGLDKLAEVLNGR